MKKKILLGLIFLFIPFLTIANNGEISTEAEEQCNSARDLVLSVALTNMSDKQIREYAYCLASYDLYDGNTNEFSTEEELFDYSEIGTEANYSISLAVLQVSLYEKILLENKRDLLKLEGETLPLLQRTYLRELTAGMDCGGLYNPQSNNNETWACMKDLRKYEYLLQKDQGWFSRNFGGFGTDIALMKASILNFFLHLFSELIAASSSLGFDSFDTLPNLPYDSSSMFDTSTLFGLINSFALGILGFLILYFFLKKGTGREEDNYKTFFIKLIFIFLITLGFPTIYGGLQKLLIVYEDALVGSISNILPGAIIISSIKMEMFNNQGIYIMSIGTIVGVIVNIILIALLGIIIIVRDLFITILGYIFFLTSIGLMGGMIRKENIFDSGTMISKGAKNLVNLLFWVLGFFISIVFSIFLFKGITIILGTIPSFSQEGLTLLEGISLLRFDTFIYLLMLGIIVFFWYKKILPATFVMVSDFIKGFLFPNDKNLGNYKDFTDSMVSGYEEIRLGKDILLKEVNFDEKVSKGKEFLNNKIDTLKEKNETFAKSVDYINDNTTAIRKSFNDIAKPLKPVIKSSVSLATGIGDGIGFNEYGDKAVRLKGINRKIETLEKKNNSIKDGDILGDARKYAIETKVSKLKKEKLKVANEVYNTDSSLLDRTMYKDSTGEIENLKKTDKIVKDLNDKHTYKKTQIQIKDLSSKKDELQKQLLGVEKDNQKQEIEEEILIIESSIQELKKDDEYLNINKKISKTSEKRKEILDSLDASDLDIPNRFISEYDKKINIHDLGLEENNNNKNISEVSENIETNKPQNKKDYVQKEDVLEIKDETIEIRDVNKNTNIPNINISDIPKEEIIQFLEKYEKEYKNSLDEDDTSMFGENKLVEFLEMDKVLNSGTLKGIGENLHGMYEKIKSENLA